MKKKAVLLAALLLLSLAGIAVYRLANRSPETGPSRMVAEGSGAVEVAPLKEDPVTLEEPVPTRFALAGSVRDAENGAPIEGAAVSSGEVKATTDAEGTYRIEGLEGGEHEVRASAEGYSPKTFIVQVAEDHEVRQDFELREALDVAWEYFRLIATNPALPALLTVQLAKTLESPERDGAAWRGKPEGTKIRLDLRVEGGSEEEVVVGFFDVVDWSRPPLHVRAFPGAGSYELTDVPPGEYFLGAIQGMPDGRWPEAGVYKRDTKRSMEGQVPEFSGLGVHREWPRAAEVAEATVSDISVLVSPAFKKAIPRLDESNVLLSWYGNWKRMDPTRVVTFRTVDHVGRAIPFCEVGLMMQRREETWGRSLWTDEHGYAYCDQLLEQFRVDRAGYYFFDPETFTHGMCFSRSLQTIFESRSLPLVTIQFDEFQRGTSRVIGRIRDQHDLPMVGFHFGVRRKETEELAGFSLSRPISDAEGRFEVDGLASGEYLASVFSFDYLTYSQDDRWPFTVPPGEGQTVVLDLEVELKELRYGRTVFEDGAAAHPVFWEPGGGPANERDGTFRVTLSRQERGNLIKNSSGLVELTYVDPADEARRVEVHIDTLSPDPANPTPVVIPRSAPR